MKREVCFAVVLAILGISGGLSAQGLSQVPRHLDSKGHRHRLLYSCAKGANVDADSNEALSDFQLYAERVKQPLSKLDIDFKELYFRSFCLHLSGEEIVFRPKYDAVESL
jgi:hypothetical protein